jgi:hypothetical protein
LVKEVVAELIEGRGLFDVERVPGVGQHRKRGARDRAFQEKRRLEARPVLVAAGDQDRQRQPRQPIGELIERGPARLDAAQGHRGADRRVRGEELREIRPPARILALKSDARRTDGIGRGKGRHAAFFEERRAPLGILLKLRALRRIACRAMAAAAQHQRESAFGIGKSEMQGRVAPHGDADNMGLGDPECVEHRSDVVTRAILAVPGELRREIRGRISPRVVGDAAIASREMAELRLMTAMIAGELMDEDDGRSRARLFVEEPDAVIGREMRHAAFPAQAMPPRLARPPSIVTIVPVV